MTDQEPLAGFFSIFAYLRRRLLYCAGAILLASSVGWWFSRDLIAVLRYPFLAVMGDERALVFTAPHEAFMAHMVIGLVFGLLVAAPYLFLEGWWVVAPVFYRQQRVRFLLFAMFSAVTFVGGAVFGYFGILPVAIDFLVKGFENKAPFMALLRVSEFMSFALKLLLVFGVAFELPVAMFILGRLGLVTGRGLLRSFRYALVVIVIAAAVFTPPDVTSQILLAVPLILLYLVGTLGVWLFGKRKR